MIKIKLHPKHRKLAKNKKVRKWLKECEKILNNPPIEKLIEDKTIELLKAKYSIILSSE